MIENYYMILISLSAQTTIYFKSKSLPHLKRMFFMYCISFVINAVPLHFLYIGFSYVLIIRGIETRCYSKVKFQKAPSLIFFNGNNGTSIKTFL